MAYIELPEIPDPLLKATTEEVWKDAGWTGFTEYTTTISLGDVVLLKRTFDDEQEYRMNSREAEERTVTEFANRLKEVLGFDA